MSRQLSLGPKSRQTALDGSGNGQAEDGPTSPGERWLVTGASVKAATNVLEAACSVYLAPAGPFNVSSAIQLLGATSTGSSGDSFGPSVEVSPGQVLVAVWQAGDPGAIATLTYWGTRTVAG